MLHVPVRVGRVLCAVYKSEVSELIQEDLCAYNEQTEFGRKEYNIHFIINIYL